MKAEELLRDAVFQLNLLVWMAKEQPAEGYRVRPFFHEHDFEIVYIEWPFPFPVETREAITQSKLDISGNPEPELILRRTHDEKGLYFEAKSDSFGPDSSNSRQARGHLVATGPAFAEVVAPLKSALLCYVVPDDKRKAMCKCLSALARELEKHKLAIGEYSCHGLAIDDHDRACRLVYHLDDAFGSYTRINEKRITVMEDLEEDTDPSPLILVFSDDDCHNAEARDLYRRSVIDKVHARLLCDLQAVGVRETYKKSPDDLLLKTSEGVFEYLGRKRQKSLRRLVRENVFKRIHDHWNKKMGVCLDGGHLVVRWNDGGEKSNFLRWLEDMRGAFDASRPPAEPPSLFDHLEDGQKEDV
ncbi:MAG: hypothetical protein GXP27_07250 [Planctomycetes bacterium]|nr:hypothetical protein [Planctomycetota bacterium]